MGLGFSHGDVSWSYGGFRHFRRKLARDIGINIDQMEGFTQEDVLLHSKSALQQAQDAVIKILEAKGSSFVGAYKYKNMSEMVCHKPMSWDKIKDPIKNLLYHSDAEDSLTVIQCVDTAPRLRELVADWSEDDFDKKRALSLADAMDEAAEAGEELEFC